MDTVTVPEAQAGDPFYAAIKARAERALDLFRERGSEIRRLDKHTWYCPSQQDDETAPPYVVHYGGEVESCSCPDFTHRCRESGQPCKHILCIGIANAKSRSGGMFHTSAVITDIDRLRSDVESLRGEVQAVR